MTNYQEIDSEDAVKEVADRRSKMILSMEEIGLQQHELFKMRILLDIWLQLVQLNLAIIKIKK